MKKYTLIIRNDGSRQLLEHKKNETNPNIIGKTLLACVQLQIQTNIYQNWIFDIWIHRLGRENIDLRMMHALR